MLSNRLINDAKTEFLIIGSHQQVSKIHINKITVGKSVIKPDKVVHSLGAWFDSNMTMNSHFGKVCSKAFHGLYNICEITKFLSEETTTILVHSFFALHIDYCNSLLYGLSQYQYDRLQRVLNVPAPVVCCRKLNRCAKVCRSGRNINNVQQVETGDDHFYLESIMASLDSLDSWNWKSREKSSEYVTLLIVGQEISLKLDTEAQVDMIPYATFKKIAGASKIMLRKPKAKLTARNRQDIPVTAVCNLSCKHKDVTYDLEFYITSMKSESVVSVSACRELVLIKFVNNLKEEPADQFSPRIQSDYKDVFEGG